MAKTSLYTSLSPELMERLEARAEADGVSKSALVALAVERYLSPRPSGAEPSKLDLSPRSPLASTGPVVDAEPIRARTPASTPAGGVPAGAGTPKQYCIHPIGRRKGTECLACGARMIR